MSAYDGPLLLDISAWGRVLLDRFAADDRARYEQAVRAAHVRVCEPFMLEALYSARDATDHARLSKHLAALPFAASPPRLFRRALDAQARLAHTPGVSHRVKPIDLLVAVIADDHAIGVLHYDHDYDVIATHSGLRFDSVWIAPRGSVA